MLSIRQQIIALGQQISAIYIVGYIPVRYATMWRLSQEFDAGPVFVRARPAIRAAGNLTSQTGPPIR